MTLNGDLAKIKSLLRSTALAPAVAEGTSTEVIDKTHESGLSAGVIAGIVVGVVVAVVVIAGVGLLAFRKRKPTERV